MMKPLKFLSCLLIIILSLIGCQKDSPTKANPAEKKLDPQIILDQVNIDSLSRQLAILSGEQSVMINDTLVTIPSRHSSYPGNILAAGYIEQKLLSYNLEVHLMDFSSTGRNVYAVQYGEEKADEYYIICGHYDSMPDSSLSPGADDDGSGCATVMEAARIISQYSARYSVIYAFWDEEEQGLRGSIAYASRASQQNEKIRGVINIDMIGWDSNDDGKFYINVRDTAQSTQLADLMLNINDQYNIGLSPQVLNPGSGSDNLPFWFQGFSAVGIEEMYGSDWNDYYHTTNDQLAHFNMDYFYKCASLCISSLSSLAEISE